MLTWVYWLIVVYLLVLTIGSLYKEEKPLLQLNCIMVLIVLLLRTLGFK